MGMCSLIFWICTGMNICVSWKWHSLCVSRPDRVQPTIAGHSCTAEHWSSGSQWQDWIQRRKTHTKVSILFPFSSWHWHYQCHDHPNAIFITVSRIIDCRHCRLHTADGLLLKPSKPATAINAQILQVRNIGHEWTQVCITSSVSKLHVLNPSAYHLFIRHMLYLSNGPMRMPRTLIWLLRHWVWLRWGYWRYRSLIDWRAVGFWRAQCIEISSSELSRSSWEASANQIIYCFHCSIPCLRQLCQFQSSQHSVSPHVYCFRQHSGAT